MSMRQMSLMALGFYAVGLGIGVYLAVTRAFWPMLVIGALGGLISFFDTAPPLRLVHRGLGEIGVFLGFGPIMVMGAYYVQARTWSWEALFASLPVGILVALVLYVNEIPDRAGDAAAGKRTLPVRWSKGAVIGVYGAAATGAFGLIVFGSIFGPMPFPVIIAAAAASLAVEVYRGMQAYYESPYQLMPKMGRNIQLHLATGMLMILGYVVAIVTAQNMAAPPFFLR